MDHDKVSCAFANAPGEFVLISKHHTCKMSQKGALSTDFLCRES